MLFFGHLDLFVMYLSKLIWDLASTAGLRLFWLVLRSLSRLDSHDDAFGTVRSVRGALRHRTDTFPCEICTRGDEDTDASPSAVCVNQWGPGTRHDRSRRSICQTGKPDTGRHCAPFSSSKRWHCPSHSQRTSFYPHPSPAHCRPSSLKGGFVTTSHFVSLTW